MAGKNGNEEGTIDNFRPQCFHHPSIPASFICQDCGRSICTYCQRNTDGIPLCPPCFRKYLDRKQKRNRKLLFYGVGTAAIVIILLVSILVLAAIFAPDPEPSDGYLRIGQSDIIPAVEGDASSPNDTLPIMFTLYISNPGERSVEGGNAEVLLMKGGIQWDSISAPVPVISSGGMTKVVVGGFQVREGKWTGRISLWRGDQRDQVISISFTITGEDIQEFHAGPDYGPGSDISDEDDISRMGGGSAFLCLLMLFIIIGVVILIIIIAGGSKGYARLSSTQLLSHPTRNRVMNYIKDNPGAHFKRIAKGVATPPGTLRHHLNYMEREGLVRASSQGMFKRYYPTGAHLDPEKMVKGNREAILEVIGRYPGVSRKDLSSIIDVPKQTLSYHLQKLLEDGAVRKERAGNSSRFFLGAPNLSA